jgi:hypothetical protein
VTHPGGKIILIDYNVGRIGFPSGWLVKSMIVVVERLAGREHFNNYRNFNSRDGLSTLLERPDLTIEKKRVLGSGNIVAYVVRRGP